MEKSFVVIGNEDSVIFKNFNEQFVDLKKIIITKEILLSSFEGFSFKEFLDGFKNDIDENKFKELISDQVLDSIFSSLDFKKEFYAELLNKIKEISKNLDVKLKEYNFMSSVSNEKYDLVLVTKDFSQTIYAAEKGELLAAIKYLLRRYLSFSGNFFRLDDLDNFQIEIYKSININKKVIIKKDMSNALIYASLGFNDIDPIDYSFGGELYFSKSEGFNFFNSSQDSAIVREHSKLTHIHINKIDKVLSSEELINLNEKTKNITDAYIELFVDFKGNIKIQHLSHVISHSHSASEAGIIYYKSSNNYNKITIETLRNSFEEDINPKYLLIRNSSEIKELLKNLLILKKYDGLIFNDNFYHPFFEFLGKKLNIDIIFYNNPLNSLLDVEIDFDNLKINGEVVSNKNPFESIINKELEEKKAIVDKLSNIDLSTPKVERKEQNNSIDSLAEKIISSSNSSVNKGAEKMDSSLYDKSGKRKSAISFLAEAALNKPKPEPKKEEIVKEREEYSNSSVSEYNNSDENKTSVVLEKEEKLNIESNEIETELNYEAKVEVKEESLDNENNKKDGDYLKIEILKNISDYLSILKTNLYTMPNIASSDNYLVDINSLSLVNGEKDLFFVVSSMDEIRNSNLKYIIPISKLNENLNLDKVENIYLLANNFEDYFKIDDFYNYKGVFINISKLSDKRIKERFLDNALMRFERVSVIALKEDLSLLSEVLEGIENIVIKDFETEEEYESFRIDLLKKEKELLFDYLNFN